MRSSSAGVKRRGSSAVDDHRVEARARAASRSPSCELERLGDRHLGAVRDRQIGACARGLRAAPAPARVCPAIGPTRAIAPNVCGERSMPERVAGRRRVEHDQVIARRAPRRARSRVSCQILTMLTSSLRAGRRRGEVLEGAAGGEHAAGDPPAERLQPLEQRPVGVDRDARQALLAAATLGSGCARGDARTASAAGVCSPTSTTIVRRPLARRQQRRARRRSSSCRRRPCR